MASSSHTVEGTVYYALHEGGLVNTLTAGGCDKCHDVGVAKGVAVVSFMVGVSKVVAILQLTAKGR